MPFKENVPQSVCLLFSTVFPKFKKYFVLVFFPILDALPPSQYTEAQSPDPQTDSSHTFQQDQTNHRTTDQTNHPAWEVQNDHLQRGVVLGPPGSPQGVKSQAQKGDRLNKLEERLDELVRMLDMVKAEVAPVYYFLWKHM